MKKHRGKTLFLVLLGLAVLMAHAETPEQVRGKKQAAALWRPADGDAAAFEAFARANTASDAATRDALFTRLSDAVVSLEGHRRGASRDLRMHGDLDRGPILPFDEALAAYDPGAHLTDDLFENKVAFTTLLNFPVYTLDEKLRLGSAWTRRQWAEARLADRFATRVPASVNLAIAKAQSDSAQYIASYNIWMHHLVDDKGVRLFPAKMRLLSHWNLRDEIKSDYADKERGRAKQRAIRKVMERIVDQTIPKAVLDNPSVDWNPFTNEVHTAAVKDYEDVDVLEKEAGPGPEPATRYATLLGAHRGTPRAEAFARRRLVSRLPASARPVRRRARRPRTGEIPHARGVRERHPEPPRQARVLEGEGPGSRRPHRGASRARLRPRVGRRPEGLQGVSEDARRKGRHELQGLQHRRSRDGAQRRADVLPLRRRFPAAPGRAEHGFHRGSRVRVPGRVRDRGGRPRRHGRLALHVRAPRGHARRVEGSDARDCARRVEPLLRSRPRRARRHASRGV